MTRERRWRAALAEHDAVVRDFVTLVRRVPASGWHQSPRPGKWSPAALVLHVCQSYELGREAGRGGTSMALRVPPLAAWLSRTFILPAFIATKRFPRGADAPIEVVPDETEARTLTPTTAAERLERAAREAASALHRAEPLRPQPRIIHAYFGALTPYGTIRLLSAHTRHHTRQLDRIVAEPRTYAASA